MVSAVFNINIQVVQYLKNRLITALNTSLVNYQVWYL